MPNRVGLASELERGVIGDGCVRREFRREKERVDLKGFAIDADWYGGVDATTDVQHFAGGRVSGEQAVGRTGTPVALRGVRREVLLVREHRVCCEEIRRSLSCHL